MSCHIRIHFPFRTFFSFLSFFHIQNRKCVPAGMFVAKKRRKTNLALNTRFSPQPMQRRKKGWKSKSFKVIFFFFFSFPYVQAKQLPLTIQYSSSMSSIWKTNILSNEQEHILYFWKTTLLALHSIVSRGYKCSRPNSYRHTHTHTHTHISICMSEILL